MNKLLRHLATSTQKTTSKALTKRQFHNNAVTSARILCTDNVDELCVKIFENRGHQVDYKPTETEEELLKTIGDYEGLVVRSATKVTPAVLGAATRMRIVGRAGVGVDNIDVAEATRQGIMVMNTPNGNTVSTAQLAMSLLVSMARKVPAANMSIKEGKWDRKSFTGIEIHDKVIGIVGCGRIGHVVAECATALGMKVIGFDPIASVESLAQAGIKKVDLDDIFKNSDFITLHTPLTNETTNLINDANLEKCKDGVHIVNCARGGIVDEEALLRGLNSGKVAGAALDVYSIEPPGENLRELLTHPNLVCTPHLGASTEEAQVNVARDIAVQMSDVFDQKEYTGILNVSYMSAATQTQMKPFMELAETLGVIHAQLSDSKVVSTKIRTWGGRDANITSRQGRELIQAQFLKGLVRYQVPNVVPDLISAPGMASEANILSQISEEDPENIGSPFFNVVQIDIKREDGSSSKIAGSVFGSVPHIVQIDDYCDNFSFKPEANHVLTFRNEDEPGAVSSVLNILSDAAVNIASFNVSRLKTSNGTKALCFMALDDDIPTKSMKALKALNKVESVARIQLR